MYLWENGNEFRGSFMNGHRHGTGKWIKWISKDLNPTATKDSTFYSYEGEYENDKKHGEGIFIWPSGNFYKGTFLNDFRHGYGEMYILLFLNKVLDRWKSLQRYVGEGLSKWWRWTLQEGTRVQVGLLWK